MKYYNIWGLTSLLFSTIYSAGVQPVPRIEDDALEQSRFNNLELTETPPLAYCPGYCSIELISNMIKNIPDDFFKKRPALCDLSLKDNLLKNIPPLKSAPHLQLIDLSENLIRTVPVDAFCHNPKLQLISLANNEIDSLPDNIFQHNPDLFCIDIRGNPLLDDFSSDEARKKWNLPPNCELVYSS